MSDGVLLAQRSEKDTSTLMLAGVRQELQGVGLLADEHEVLHWGGRSCVTGGVVHTTNETTAWGHGFSLTMGVCSWSGSSLETA
jgi:hypothetical protein